MHPYILQSLAAERARDFRKHAAAARQGRMARRSRPAPISRAVALRAGPQSRPAQYDRSLGAARNRGRGAATE
jgi:hypothetical protein